MRWAGIVGAAGLAVALAGCNVGGRPRPETTTAPTSVVTFGTFDTSTTGWIPLGEATLALSHRFFHQGAVSLVVSSRAATLFGAYAPNLVSEPEHGALFRLSMWIKPNQQAVGGTVLIELTESGDTAKVEDTAKKRVRLRAGWHEVSLAGRVRAAGRTSLSVSVTETENIIVGAAVYIDSVVLGSRST